MEEERNVPCSIHQQGIRLDQLTIIFFHLDFSKLHILMKYSNRLKGLQ